LEFWIAVCAAVVPELDTRHVAGLDDSLLQQHPGQRARHDGIDPALLGVAMAFRPACGAKDP
jgi:hypothetical protein